MGQKKRQAILNGSSFPLRVALASRRVRDIVVYPEARQPAVRLGCLQPALALTPLR
jgi:hypothetical protein